MGGIQTFSGNLCMPAQDSRGEFCKQRQQHVKLGSLQATQNCKRYVTTITGAMSFSITNSYRWCNCTLILVYLYNNHLKSS